jgi:hypothetical protein
MTEETPRWFRVMDTTGSRPGSKITGGFVPWSLVSPHEAQARANHGQTLLRLHACGGLSWCELLAVLENRPWKRLDQELARDQVIALKQAHEATVVVPRAPTDAQMLAGRAAVHRDDGSALPDMVYIGIYRAMVEAAAAPVQS